MIELIPKTDLRARLDPQETGALNKEERKRLSAQFESLLVHELVKSMRSTVNTGDSDFGVSMSTDLMDQSLSEVVAGRLGLGEHLLKQLDPSQIARPPRSRISALPSTRGSTPNPAAALERTVARTHPRPRATLPRLDKISLVQARPDARLPVQGRISSSFGPRVDPIHGATKEHHGIDIAAERGAEIYAVRDGRVRFAGEKGGYGKTVEIEHRDGSISRYAHAERIHVRVGDRIEAGECIADVGSTGRSTGPHLHFEIRKYGKAVDPLEYLKQEQ